MAEYNASGGWRTDFLLDGANVGQILDSNGSLYMWATDALGNAVESLQYGSLQISRLYPFGEEGQATSAEYKWTNQIRDGNALDHFAFRTYSSNLARWLSPDPAGLAAVNPAAPSSWNRYSYVGNQPLAYTDPTGLLRPGPGPDPFTTDPFFLCGLYDLCGGFSGGFAPLFPAGTGGGGGGNRSTQQAPHSSPVRAPSPPCDQGGSAPSPSEYAAEGSAVLGLETTSASLPAAGGSLAFNLSGLAMNGLNLLSFHRGGRLDAQVRYGGSQAYGNYAFGAYMAAAGFSLRSALSAANLYGEVFSRYRPGTVYDQTYAYIPAVNVENITLGYNAELSGNLCSPR